MMQIAYRKQAWFDGEIWDFVTNAFSGFGGYSHTELVFSDGLCFSADPDSGLRIKEVDRSDARLWEHEQLDISPDDEARIRAWAETEIATHHPKYDWGGVIRFVWPWSKEHPQDYFCSESTVAALQLVPMLCDVKAWQVSPNKLHKLEKKRCMVVASDM